MKAGTIPEPSSFGNQSKCLGDFGPAKDDGAEIMHKYAIPTRIKEFIFG
jgi:hypothetical protein